jgi:hypothetical protein
LRLTIISHYRKKDILKRLLSTILTAGLVVGGLTASAGASQADPSKVRTLGAINVIRGGDAASMSVRLAQPATLRQPEYSKTSVSADGAGELVGFALAQEPFDLDRSAALIASRMPRQSGSSPVLSLGFGLRETNKGYHLPAGRYRLYLITDGTPATVTFRLSGVTGTRYFEPTSPADVAIKSPEIQLADGLDQIYSGGADSLLRSNGILFNHLAVKHEAHTSSLTQFCYSAGAPEPAENPAPYAPGCPSTNQKAIFTQPSTYLETSPTRIDFYGGAVGSPGRWGQGFSYESGGVVDEIDFAALWLGLE